MKFSFTNHNKSEEEENLDVKENGKLKRELNEVIEKIANIFQV
jgi:hypothetical protein